MLRTLIILPVLLLWAAPALAEESIWLRGSGGEVWIERSGAPEEPAPDRKGFTRVATSPDPVVNRRYQAGERPPLRKRAVVVLGQPHWAHDEHLHEFTPHYWYPRYSYRLYPRYYAYPRYRYYYPRHYYPSAYRYRFHYGDYDWYFGRSRPNRHYDGGHAGGGSGGERSVHRSGGGGRSGHVVRGGAYRRP